MTYLNWTVQELFQRAASPEPEPGGGGVSAMSGSLGCGMLLMVARITGQNKKYLHLQQELNNLIAAIEQDMEALKVLAKQDMEAFEHFMSVLALPRDTEEQKQIREQEKNKAAVTSARIPLSMAEACLNSLRSAKTLAAVGSPLAISDVGVGANLLEAALKGALLMVEANIPYIQDKEILMEIIRRKEMMTVDAVEVSQTALNTVRSRMKM